MYQYDNHDHRLVRSRVDEFRDQVARYLNGALDEDQFAQYRLRNGLYRQKHAHMLRVAIPYGLLSSRQLRTLAYIASEYDKGYGHFTTRQNIQFNWPKLEQVPDILEHLADVDMHTIQTSGNCIRNISSDQYAGVAADEIEDPRPYCEMLRQWSTLHPEFYWLPRKFKIAVSGAANDRTAVFFHDIGLKVVKNERSTVGFQVIVGGGLGRTPVIGKVIRPFLPREYLLSYCEAILRIYNLYGRRDNKYKARIKILLNEMGQERFVKEVEAEWQRIKHGPLRLYDVDFNQMKQYFADPLYEPPERQAPPLTAMGQPWNKAFLAWFRNNTHSHKLGHYRIVVISLKHPQVPPGDLSASQMQQLADMADRFSHGELRVTHEQNLVFAHVRNEDLFDLWQVLEKTGLATANIGTLADMICCPGLDFCSLANASSIPVAKQISQLFDNQPELEDIGELKLKISGCMNACGHHHVGHIGILGVDKKGEEWYQLTLGGSADDTPKIGDRLGRAVPRDKVADTVSKIVDVYKSERQSGETFLQTYCRLGIKPFQEKVYE